MPWKGLFGRFRKRKVHFFENLLRSDIHNFLRRIQIRVEIFIFFRSLNFLIFFEGEPRKKKKFLHGFGFHAKSYVGESRTTFLKKRLFLFQKHEKLVLGQPMVRATSRRKRRRMTFRRRNDGRRGSNTCQFDRP